MDEITEEKIEFWLAMALFLGLLVALYMIAGFEITVIASLAGLLATVSVIRRHD